MRNRPLNAEEKSRAIKEAVAESVAKASSEDIWTEALEAGQLPINEARKVRAIFQKAISDHQSQDSIKTENLNHSVNSSPKDGATSGIGEYSIEAHLQQTIKIDEEKIEEKFQMMLVYQKSGTKMHSPYFLWQWRSFLQAFSRFRMGTASALILAFTIVLLSLVTAIILYILRDKSGNYSAQTRGNQESSITQEASAINTPEASRPDTDTIDPSIQLPIKPPIRQQHHQPKFVARGKASRYQTPQKQRGNATPSVIPLAAIRLIFIDPQTDQFKEELFYEIVKRLEGSSTLAYTEKRMESHARLKINEIQHNQITFELISGQQVIWSMKRSIKSSESALAVKIAADLVERLRADIDNSKDRREDK